MTHRRILRVENGQIVVLPEGAFESEQVLHAAVAAHPEVLPVEDLGLDPLVTIASEMSVEGGFIDALATDRLGRLAIIEFKKGTENPDARKVVAQLLDYASSVWGMTYEELERAAGLDTSLVDHVQRGLGEPDDFDEEAFRKGVEDVLESGRFTLVYVARDLDGRMSRIMQYMAEALGVGVLAVEVDYFRTDGQESAVLVPRAVVAPRSVTTKRKVTETPSAAERLAAADPEVRQFKERLDAYAREKRLLVLPKKMVTYRSEGGIRAWFYADSGHLQFDFKGLREREDLARVDRVAEGITALTDRPPREGMAYPSLPCAAALKDWSRTRAEVLDPYFGA